MSNRKFKPIPELSPEQIARFKSKILITKSGCHEWQGNTTTQGYGSFLLYPRRCSGKDKRYAHRVAFKLHNGFIDDSLLVCHTCDNHPCVNGEHLLQGTHEINSADMTSKKRQGFGESHSQAKLTDKDVKQIRKLRRQGLIIKDIAFIFGVSYETTRQVLTGETWTHV